MNSLTAKSELLINVSCQEVFAAFCDKRMLCNSAKPHMTLIKKHYQFIHYWSNKL